MLRLRAARFLGHPARVHVYAWGAPLGVLEARPGGHRVYALPMRAGRGPLRLDLVSDDPELALAVDWVRGEGLAWRVGPRVWPARVLVAGVFAVALLAGFALPGALAAAGTVALAAAAWMGADPFAAAHALARMGVPAVVCAAAAALLARRWERGRFVPLIFLAGYLLKGAALFHPTYFYNDVRNNLRYVLALREGEGTLAERNHAAQVKVGVAYPRIVAGRRYAFPYAPVFFLPFGMLPEERIVEAIKHVALLCAAAEAVAVFALGRLVLGSGTALAAGIVAVLLPPLYSRLMLAMWSTVAGHFLDTLVVLATAALAGRPASWRLWAAQAAGTLAAFLTYISSLFNLTLLAGWSALRCRSVAGRVLAGWALALAVTLGWLYAGFVALFLREILPAALAGQQMAAEGGGRAGGLVEALSRVPIFYGWGYPALAVAGFVVLRRRAARPAFRIVSAHASSVLTLVALRAFGGGLFRDLKEIEFAAPLVALCAGAALAELGGRGRPGALAAALVGAGLFAFSAARYAEYLRAYASLAGVG